MRMVPPRSTRLHPRMKGVLALIEVETGGEEEEEESNDGDGGLGGVLLV